MSSRMSTRQYGRIVTGGSSRHIAVALALTFQAAAQTKITIAARIVTPWPTTSSSVVRRRTKYSKELPMLNDHAR